MHLFVCIRHYYLFIFSDGCMHVGFHGVGTEGSNFFMPIKRPVSTQLFCSNSSGRPKSVRAVKLQNSVTHGDFTICMASHA